MATISTTRAEIAEALDALSTFMLRQSAPLREVSFSAATTLSTLHRFGPHRLTDLAAREAISQPSMTTLVSRLERQGFARRQQDPSDRRIVLVAITDAGREMLDRRRRSRIAFLSSLLGELTPDQERSVTEAVAALHELIDLDRVPAALAAANAVMTGESIES